MGGGSWFLCRARARLPALLLGALLTLPGGGTAAEVEWIDTPTSAGDETPWLRADESGLSLSWVHRDDDNFQLLSSRFGAGGWQSPQAIAAGSGWFNSSADFARVMPLGGGVQLAVWLEMTSFRDYFYRFNSALSRDNGVSWQATGFPPGIVDYGQQGFVSALSAEGDIVLFWIAGFRDEAKLWRARLDRAGRWSSPEPLDERVCACCRTAVSNSGTLVYRDRDPQEIRDIRLLEAAATAPAGAGLRLHEDGWEISGCPVNGPAIAANPRQQAIAWFTAADELAETRLAVGPFDPDSKKPLLALATGRSRGLVDVTWVDDSRLALSTLTRDQGIEVSQVVLDNGILSIEKTTRLPLATGLGTPTLAMFGERLYLALYDVGQNRIRVARINLSAAQR